MTKWKGHGEVWNTMRNLGEALINSYKRHERVLTGWIGFELGRPILCKICALNLFLGKGTKKSNKGKMRKLFCVSFMVSGFLFWISIGCVMDCRVRNVGIVILDCQWKNSNLFIFYHWKKMRLEVYLYYHVSKVIASSLL